jgi:hypothetical protein
MNKQVEILKYHKRYFLKHSHTQTVLEITMLKGVVSRDGLSTETIGVYSSLGLNNPLCICLTPRKTCVKNLWRNKQGNCRCKMAGAGIWSFAKFRGQMPRIATTGITSWQTALKWTADWQVPRSGCHSEVKPVAIRSQMHNSVCCNPRDGYSILGNLRSKHRGLPQSVAHIWAQNLVRDWIPAPAILHWESSCLKCHIFLWCDF